MSDPDPQWLAGLDVPGRLANHLDMSPITDTIGAAIDGCLADNRASRLVERDPALGRDVCIIHGDTLVSGCGIGDRCYRCAGQDACPHGSKPSPYRHGMPPHARIIWERASRYCEPCAADIAAHPSAGR